MGDFTKKKRLFAGFRKISSEVQKSSCIVHRCTVYDFIAKKERRNGMLAGAAPVTFRVEKRMFRADSPARRGKYATLNVENWKTVRGRPRTRRENSLREDLCPWETDSDREGNEQEEIYEEAYLELSHGAGPVPDAAANGGAGRGDGGDGADAPGRGGTGRPGKRGSEAGKPACGS